jgi:hypothetical protein
MNGNSLSNQFDSDIREVAFLICREFPDAFQQDPRVRIESFLDMSWMGYVFA